MNEAAKQRNEDDVIGLKGQEYLDALTIAYRDGDFKGWTFSEMNRGGSVLPNTVYDEKDSHEPIIRHEAIVSVSLDHGRITLMTLAVTTPEGATYQDFVPLR